MHPVELQLENARQRGYMAAFRILGNKHDAQDACQEAVIRALQAKERYDPKRPFYPWFYRILKNLCLDRLRAVTSAAVATVTPKVEAQAEHTILRNERDRALNRAVAELPEELREMIELRHFQDLSYAQMAEVLEIPQGTVMSRLYRARKQLKERLEKDPGFQGGAA